MPCHNDLLAANLLLDGASLCIVDWEYAGMGDRYFDLGNLAVNNGLRRDGRGRAARGLLRRAATGRRHAALRLMRFMSGLPRGDVGVVQGTISELDFDFDGYAAKHFERLRETAADARFKRWIEEASGGKA